MQSVCLFASPALFIGLCSVLFCTEWSRKNAQSFMHHRFAIVCSRITRFSPNAHKLTSNTKNGHILNILIKCSLAAGKGTT